MSDDYSAERWLIGFYDPPRCEGHWWNIFTRKGFRHVIALAYLPDQKRWLVLDWHSRGIGVTSIADSLADTLIAFVRLNNGQWLHYKRPEYPPAPWFPARFPVTCVGFVKHLLGVQSWALTPFRLFCDLRARGAEGIFTEILEGEADGRAGERRRL